MDRLRRVRGIIVLLIKLLKVNRPISQHWWNEVVPHLDEIHFLKGRFCRFRYASPADSDLQAFLQGFTACCIIHNIIIDLQPMGFIVEDHEGLIAEYVNDPDKLVASFEMVGRPNDSADSIAATETLRREGFAFRERICRYLSESNE
jgi:hypothetical protein